MRIAPPTAACATTSARLSHGGRHGGAPGDGTHGASARRRTNASGGRERWRRRDTPAWSVREHERPRFVLRADPTRRQVATRPSFEIMRVSGWTTTTTAPSLRRRRLTFRSRITASGSSTANAATHGGPSRSASRLRRRVEAFTATRARRATRRRPRGPAWPPSRRRRRATKVRAAARFARVERELPHVAVVVDKTVSWLRAAHSIAARGPGTPCRRPKSIHMGAAAPWIRDLRERRWCKKWRRSVAAPRFRDISRHAWNGQAHRTGARRRMRIDDRGRVFAERTSNSLCKSAGAEIWVEVARIRGMRPRAACRALAASAALGRWRRHGGWPCRRRARWRRHGARPPRRLRLPFGVERERQRRRRRASDGRRSLLESAPPAARSAGGGATRARRPRGSRRANAAARASRRARATETAAESACVADPARRCRRDDPCRVYETCAYRNLEWVFDHARARARAAAST